MTRRAVVMGLGASGRSAAQLLVRQGWEVVGVDLRTTVEPIDGVRLELGPHRRATFLGADRIVVSPGVPPTQPDVSAAEVAGVEVISEIELALEAIGAAPMIGVTGTNGKSTVTHFTGHLLGSGRRVFVGGNLGVPLCDAVGTDYDVYVVELSSYQLERSRTFAPRAAAILNLTPDHLERHGTMRAYGEAKAKIFAYQRPEDFALLPSGDELLADVCAGSQGQRLWLGATPGAVRDRTELRVELPGMRDWLDLGVVPVPGEHNLDNAAVAATLALAFGASNAEVQARLETLTSLPHRMQVVPSTDGRRWIDDSKATNLAATLAAVRGQRQPTILLLGGQAKGGGFHVLADHLEHITAIVCFGGSGQQIHDELVTVGVRPMLVAGLREAVVAARGLSKPGDDILLSPGCASFDAFTDFADRGRRFASWVGGAR